MIASRALRVRVALAASIALLLHALAPALHVRIPGDVAGTAEWTEVCTGSGQTVFVRVDGPGAASDDSADRLRTPLPAGDHQCPPCATHAENAAPTRLVPLDQDFLDADAFAGEQKPPARVVAWSALQSRGPPVRS